MPEQLNERREKILENIILNNLIANFRYQKWPSTFNRQKTFERHSFVVHVELEMYISYNSLQEMAYSLFTFHWHNMAICLRIAIN